MLYVATVNTPGYLPESEPYLTETAGEAWEYLAEELRHDAEGVEDGGRPRNYDWALETIDRNVSDAEGPLTGIWVHDESDSIDLGLVYSVDRYTGPCEWFALCDRVAETLLDHPILDQVPTCQRCADKVARLSA